MLPKFEIILKPEAEKDIIAIRDWYEETSSDLGKRFLDNFIATLKKLEQNPQYCLNVGFGYRRANIKDFPYSIFLRIEDRTVFILGVFHQHRDPEEWQKRTT